MPRDKLCASIRELQVGGHAFLRNNGEKQPDPTPAGRIMKTRGWDPGRQRSSPLVCFDLLILCVCEPAAFPRDPMMKRRRSEPGNTGLNRAPLNLNGHSYRCEE